MTHQSIRFKRILQLQNSVLSWGTVRVDGHLLSYEDSKRVYIAMCLYRLLLIDVVNRVLHSLKVSENVTTKTYASASRSLKGALYCVTHQSLCRHDLGDLNTFLKSALAVLRTSPKQTGCCSWKLALKRVRPQLKQDGVGLGHTYELITALIACFILSASHEVFRDANTAIQFLLRLTLDDVDWIIEENIEDYLSFEDSLKQLEYDPGAIKEVRAVIDDWFRDFDTNHLDYVIELHNNHSYGATAEVARSVGTAKKLNFMYPSDKMYHLCRYTRYIPSRHMWDNMLGKAYYEHYKAKKGMDTSSHSYIGQIQFVPKGVNKKRVVSKEPTLHQFFQGRIGQMLDFHFQRHPEMKISLHDQSRNQTLAKKGSSNGAYCTIDLSNASDSVTLTLVKEIFVNQQRLLRALLWCRTEQVNVSGNVVSLEKFAPMGAGDCFPIECIVFSACIAAVLRRHRSRLHYVVYGDDMVVPTKYYEEIIKFLQLMHFQVNVEKSFNGEDGFTESCGSECLWGYDVDPLRLSRQWNIIDRISGQYAYFCYCRSRKRRLQYLEYCLRRNRDLSRDTKSILMKTARAEDRRKDLYTIGCQQLQSHYRLANSSLDRGYYRLYEGVVSLTEILFSAPVYSASGRIGIRTYKSLTPDDFVTVWDKSTQSLYAICDELNSVQERVEDDIEYCRLLEAYDVTMREKLSDPEDRLSLSCGPSAFELSKGRFHIYDLIT